jgi:hypothetical protein
MDRESTIKLLQKGKACSLFLIISYWPITYHVVKMVIQSLGLDSGVIIAADSTGDRAAVAEFNNSKEKYQAINKTYLCGGTGLNPARMLQDCDPDGAAPKFNVETQTISCVYRIGQSKP